MLISVYVYVMDQLPLSTGLFAFWTTHENTYNPDQMSSLWRVDALEAQFCQVESTLEMEFKYLAVRAGFRM